MRKELLFWIVVIALGVGVWRYAGDQQSKNATASWQQWRIMDLGHSLAESDPTWSGEKSFSRTAVASLGKDGYAAGKFATEEHFGTHVDAPAHFSSDGATVDRIPADELVRPGVCINIETQAARDDDYRLAPSDIEAFERAHGTIPAGTIVLIATGWDRRWPDAARYMNTRDRVKHFPGLTVEATRVLARDRKVAAIGIDTPSIDYGPSTEFESHHTSMPLGVYHIENAANLTTLPPTGFTVVVAPIDIKGGSGGPARMFALFPR
jgi:kynurenine formamidase